MNGKNVLAPTLLNLFNKIFENGHFPKTWLVFFDISVFEMMTAIKFRKFTVFSSGSFCQIYRVTDEALIAEIMVWPNFFFMNVFFALKGSKPFIIICNSTAQDRKYK